MKNTLPALLWCFSAVLAAWLWAPHLVACLGAALGCLTATALSRQDNTRLRWLIFLASCLVGLAAQFVLANVPLGNPGHQILARSGILCWLATHGGVFFLHQFHRTALVPLECALFATPWVLWLQAHRQGHLDRPVGLMEPMQGLGLEPTRVLAVLGLFLGLSIVLLIGARQSRQLGLAPIIWAISLGLAASFLIPSQRLNRIATQESELSGPGQVQERRVATTPVAVIVFYSEEAPELEVFHFQPRPHDDGLETRPESRTARYRVAEIVAQNRPLVRGWEAQRTPVVVPDGETFASVYEITSKVPSASLIELMESSPPPLEPIAHSRFQALLDQAVPISDRSHPVRAALRVKLWMEQNRTQGQETAQGTVDDCLLRAQPVNQETFTRAAHQLLLELGVPNRVVSGYAVRADQKGTGSFLLLTEQDRRCWLELTSHGYRGLEFDLYPLDGPNQSEGPQNLEMQRQLGELARARQPGYQPLPGLGVGAMGFTLFILVAVSSGYGIKLYRWLRGYLAPPERRAVATYRSVLDRLAEVEELRASGETRYEFSQRLKMRVPSLEALTMVFQRSTLGRPGLSDEDPTPALFRACLAEIAESYPRRRRWLGYLHPFSWSKVH